MAKVLNFDKFISEKKKEMMDVVVFGKTYKVPMQIPASVPVAMARAEQSPTAEQSTIMIMRAADAMFGEANVNEMCAKGMSAKELAELISKLFVEINGSDDEDEETEELTDEDSRKPTAGKKTKK